MQDRGLPPAPGKSLSEALARSLRHKLMDHLRSTASVTAVTRARAPPRPPAPVEWVQQTDRREDGESARERDRAESGIALQALSGPSQLWDRITLRQLFPASPVGRGVPTATSLKVWAEIEAERELGAGGRSPSCPTPRAGSDWADGAFRLPFARPNA